MLSMKIVASIHSKAARHNSRKFFNLTVDLIYSDFLPLLTQHHFHLCNSGNPFRGPATLNSSLHKCPYSLNWIKIWRVGDPVQFGNTQLLSFSACVMCTMRRGTIFHKNKIWVLL